MRKLALTGLVVLTAALGFVAVLAGLNVRDDVSPEIDTSFKAQAAAFHTLGKGWGQVDVAGTEIAGSPATFTLQLPRPPPTDMLVELAGSSIVGRRNAEFTVVINGRELGVWRPGISEVKRLVLPATAVAAGGNINVELIAPTSAASAIVRNFAVKVPQSVRDFMGNIESCTRDSASGWSIAGDAAAPIAVRRGQEVTVTIPDIVRSDLEKAGMPRDGGFIVRFTPPLAANEAVELRFYGSGQIPGAKCR